MDPRVQMAISQSAQAAEFNAMSKSILLPCWRICGDRHLTREHLTDPQGVPDPIVQQVNACSRKCIARHFEVLQLMMDTRELREKEMIQGLAPGTLTGDMI